MEGDPLTHAEIAEAHAGAQRAVQERVYAWLARGDGRAVLRASVKMPDGATRAAEFRRERRRVDEEDLVVVVDVEAPTTVFAARRCR